MDDIIFIGYLSDIIDAVASPEATIVTTLGSMVVSKLYLDNNVSQLMPGLLEGTIELHKKNRLYGCRLLKIDENQYGLRIVYEWSPNCI